MIGFLIFAFTVIPVLELYLLFQAGAVIGGWETIGIVILTGVVGAYLAKYQGQSVLIEIQTKLNQGDLPANHMIQGLLIFGGGLLLLTPGFMTDLLGFSMVLPGTRHLISAWLQKHFRNKIHTQGSVKFYTFGGGGFERSPWKQKQDVPRQVNPDVIDADFEKK